MAAELQMQIDDRILEETPPQGPSELQIVFDCKKFHYKVGHIITKGDNGGWRDSYIRIPEKPKASIKINLLILTQENT